MSTYVTISDARETRPFSHSLFFQNVYSFTALAGLHSSVPFSCLSEVFLLGALFFGDFVIVGEG